MKNLINAAAFIRGNTVSVRPVNRFVVRFSFLQQDDQKKKHTTSFKTRFSAKFPGANGLTGKKKVDLENLAR